MSAAAPARPPVAATLASAVVSFPVGALLAVGRNGHNPVVRWLCTGYIEIFRSVPTLLLVYVFLFALPGIGPWTADVVGLRALGERDVLLGTDLAVRRQLEARGITATAAWSPFRSYATVHLWRPYV